MQSFMTGKIEREAMPETCREFDYSFDVSSKKDSEVSGFNLVGTRKMGEAWEGEFSRIEEEGVDMS